MTIRWASLLIGVLAIASSPAFGDETQLKNKKQEKTLTGKMQPEKKTREKTLGEKIKEEADRAKEQQERHEKAFAEKRSEKTQRTVKEMSDAIRNEIAAIGDHLWAGEYYMGDGAGNVSLAVAPKAGFVFERRGSVGVQGRNYGSVELQDGLVCLKCAFDNTREGSEGIAEKFVPVVWGSRKYLVPEETFRDFCNRVNAGHEPRKRMYGLELLRVGDDKKSVTGLPDVPEKYRPYLLKEPIRAEIVDVGDSVKRATKELKKIDTPVKINVGKESGLLPGMELHLQRRGGALDAMIRITKVGEETSDGIAEQDELWFVRPAVGWKISTRAWWYDKSNRPPQRRLQTR